ncbi:hypothetical protein AMAG_04585 [Allomyces macrogynus ATCC 38327]|uniref:Syntaxin N-terminal domain-containing protein n=1 Tax=Allomyces macrogynus (strain ATCC 38327) TaxID=578462 RepID=A0A0L0S5N2_ALLM3|nr:hypothetical protein AMAG_04585 [Allomyces macrogynus ATCC 38327]|eukprot:KNE57726.1 hypothetical protein AMAG_04585 [Allomyces macrogynus ATCC 38327]
MTTMKDAIKRLKLIDEACNPKEKDAENQGLDEFTKLKKQISNDVKAVRQIIKERDDLLKADKSSKKGVGSGTETAELSFKVRSHLKTIKEEIAQLDAIVKKAEKKLKGKNKPDLQEIIDSRKEIVKLCQSHLEECENLDKARFNDKMAARSRQLILGRVPRPARRRASSTLASSTRRARSTRRRRSAAAVRSAAAQHPTRLPNCPTLKWPRTWP